jgi:hypothetical protein
MRRTLALLFFALCACDTPGHRDTGGPRVDFVIAGITFHASSGAAVSSSGGLAFYLSDQPDTCLALGLVPVGTAITFSLHINPPADGTTQATVVAKTTPAAGEANGSLQRATGGKPDTTIAAANGSVAWTANTDGSVGINSLDVGFTGTADRLTTSGLTLAHCTP